MCCSNARRRSYVENISKKVSFNVNKSFTKGEFVWDQSGKGIMRVSVCMGVILIPEYLDFHSGYSAPRSRIAGIYSRIHSYSGISQTNVPYVCWVHLGLATRHKTPQVMPASVASLIVVTKDHVVSRCYYALYDCVL